MKRWLTIIIILCLIPIVVAQAAPAPPTDTSTAIFQKIDLEEKNTRKFVSDELTRQREAWTAAIDDRASYYETTANNLIQTATWKFGLIWAGVMFFIISLEALLRTRTERKKYDKLKKAVTEATSEHIMNQLQRQQNYIQDQLKGMNSRITTISETKPIPTAPQPVPRPVSEPSQANPQTSLTEQQFLEYLKKYNITPPQPAQPNPVETEFLAMMQKYGLKPQQTAQDNALSQLPLPTPPPFAMPPAPRKLGYFERRRLAKLEKEHRFLSNRQVTREAEIQKLTAEMTQLNPMWGK